MFHLLDMADLTDEQVIDHLYAALDANNVDQFRLLMDEAQRGIWYTKIIDWNVYLEHILELFKRT